MYRNALTSAFLGLSMLLIGVAEAKTVIKIQSVLPTKADDIVAAR